MGAPFGSLAEADVSATPAGTTLALAKGEHTAGLRVFGGLSFVGACASQTRIGASASEGAAVFDVVGADVGFRDLGIEAPRNILQRDQRRRAFTQTHRRHLATYGQTVPVFVDNAGVADCVFAGGRHVGSVVVYVAE